MWKPEATEGQCGKKSNFYKRNLKESKKIGSAKLGKSLGEEIYRGPGREEIGEGTHCPLIPELPLALSLSLSTIKNQGFGQPEHISNPGIEKGQYEFGPYDINLRSASLQSYLSAELQNLSFSILQIGTYMKSMKLQLLWFPDSENPWAAIWEPWINPALIGAHAAVV